MFAGSRVGWTVPRSGCRVCASHPVCSSISSEAFDSYEAVRNKLMLRDKVNWRSGKLQGGNRGYSDDGSLVEATGRVVARPELRGCRSNPERRRGPDGTPPGSSEGRLRGRPGRGAVPAGQPGCRQRAPQVGNCERPASGPAGGSGTASFRALRVEGEEGIAPAEATLNKAQNWRQKITGNRIGKQSFYRTYERKQ